MVMEIGLAGYLPRHQLRARLQVCSASGLPASLLFQGEVKTRWKFLKYKQINGIQIPQLIENYEEDDMGWCLECEDVQICQGDNFPQKIDVLQETKTEYDSRIIFDPKKSSVVQGKLSSDGRIFLPVRLNEQNVGYALLDTGCQHSTIRWDIAQKFKLQSWGSVELQGITSQTKGQWCKADTLQVGPVTFKDPKFCQSKVLPVGQSPPVQVVGFLGYDFFQHVVVDIPVLKIGQSDCGISLQSPQNYTPPPKILPNRWTQIQFRKNMPVIQAKIILPRDDTEKSMDEQNQSNQENEIVLKLIFDTGGATELMVVDEIYQKLRNLGRQSKAAVQGVGGATLDSSKVNVQQLFIGSSLLRNVTCFQIPKQAEAGFQCVDGLLGGRILDRADVVLDYTNEKIAFLPQKRRS